MPTLTAEQVKLFLDPNFAVVATVRRGGSPQTSVVWIDWDGENVVFTTRRERAKGRHLTANPRVSVIVWDSEHPYRYVEVEGDAELDDAGAEEHIHKMSHKYRGVDYPEPHGRVLVRIRPERIHAFGFG